jgi:hypothetical protein
MELRSPSKSVGVRIGSWICPWAVDVVLWVGVRFDNCRLLDVDGKVEIGDNFVG